VDRHGARIHEVLCIAKYERRARLCRADGATQSDAVGTIGVNFEHKLAASTKIIDKLNVTSGSPNTNVANDLALSVAMTGRVALNVGYGIRYNSNPAAGVQKLNQLTTVNVVHSLM
jgi:putative salt-induced outer membrane protein YdiY